MYTIVQYLEDPVRKEPRNVGVLLATQVDLYRSFVERDDVDTDRVARFQELLEYILEAELAGLRGQPDLVLEELARRRFSHFRLTPPLQASALPDQPEAALDVLRERLVQPQHRAAGCF
jgi:hypothetical protein